MAIIIVPDLVMGAGPATTTFEALLTEFYARGFDYLNQDDSGRLRAQRWINQSYLALCEEEDWPFLRATAYGTAPMEISDLSEVKEVMDLTTDLQLMQFRELELTRAQREDEGEPCHYYVDDLTVGISPPNPEHDLAVRYRRTPEPLEEEGHVCLIPNRFVDMVIDGAAIKGLKDSDNWESVIAAQQAYDHQLAGMRKALLHRQPIQRFIIPFGW